jgi:hypothetical protein
VPNQNWIAKFLIREELSVWIPYSAGGRGEMPEFRIGTEGAGALYIKPGK